MSLFETRDTLRKKALLAGLVFLSFEIVLFLFIDKPVSLYIANLDGSQSGLVDFFRRITDLGKGAWYLWPCGLAALFCAFLSRGKEVPPAVRHLFGYVGVRALFLFATIGLSGIAANILKVLFGRARPKLFLREHLYGFAPLSFDGSLWASLPSGHTTTAFALAFSLAALYPRGRILWFAYALLLAASRIMVNAHYVSDTLAGAALGGLTVWLFSKYGMNHLAKVIFPIDSRERTP
ncbi:MAG: phosphatase PAP2 family protein [Alphaproteobacteria bacterium]|nr:phosphatase PAP2 family protein [Alphaproteobacteria bacterium]